jgi:separase
MATKDEPTRLRIDKVKADLRSTATCLATTVATLQDLLLKKSEEPSQKENVQVKVQPTARRRAGTATATAAVGDSKQASATASPRERYILATEVANITLKNLADALKSLSNAPTQRPSSQSKPNASEDARKPIRPRVGHTKTASVSKRPLKERSVSQLANSPQKPSIRRSSSYSSFLTAGPDTGLVSTAECARIAFAYLGTTEASKVLGKDSQDLQLENGILALIGKLVALGLDGLAVKEMRHLKKRLDKYLGHDTAVQRPASRATEKAPQRATPGEKESVASLLEFGTVTPESPALSLIVNLQTYALRIISRLNRPRIVEATWEHLKLSNPSSPANLIHHTALTPNGQAKAARQLESLAQTILSLCPHISSSHDETPLQPSPDVALLLQHLAFKVRKDWWTFANHQGDEEHELLEPFAKCLIAFDRRSQSSPRQKYRTAELLYEELAGSSATSKSTGTISKTMSSLAQAAGVPKEALRWLGSSKAAATSTSASKSTASQSKQSARLVRIATVSIEAYVKDNSTPGLDDSINDALEALGGSLSGSSSDLDALYVEVNSFRRAATRMLIDCSSGAEDNSRQVLVEILAARIIASSVHFSARLAGAKLQVDTDDQGQQRHHNRMALVSKGTKSMVDSVLMFCKIPLVSQEQWQERDVVLQECSHIIHRLEEETTLGANPDLLDHEVIQALIVKLSNAYWSLHLQSRKVKLSSETYVTAMQRSIGILQSKSQDVQTGGHLTTKLEQLGDALDGLDLVEKSRKAFSQCIQAYLDSDTTEALSALSAKKSLQEVFENEGPLSTFVRVVKSHHRSFLKAGLSTPDELAFFDTMNGKAGVRGALLEFQLGLYLRTLSKNRQWDSKLDLSLAVLVQRLQELYTPENFPVRRLRLLASQLQLSQSHANIPSSGSLSSDLSSATINTASSEDEGLTRFGPHLVALCKLKAAMQEATPPTDTLRECFSTWESVVDTATSWKNVVDRVDDANSWISDVKASVEFLNAKGEEYLALPVLHLLAKIFELRKDLDKSDLVISLCALGLQFLRLGYTGKAGLSLAKAETLVTHRTISTEAKLGWYIAYAEYLARIGNTAKRYENTTSSHVTHANIVSIITMATAQKCALADVQFMDLAKSSTTLSGRVRFNRVLADAAFVSSLIATIGGCYKDAARHARQCVTLNRRIWAALESRTIAKATEPVDTSEFDVGGSSKIGFDPLSSMRNDKGAPLVMSVTHDALDGSDFWTLVPSLYRGLMQHSQVFAHQGLLQEAIYVAEQAEKVASATKSPTLMTDNASWRADCWAQSGRPDKAQPILDSLSTDASRKCLSVVGYQSAVARVHHWNGQYDEEVASYGKLNQLLQDLTSPLYIRSLDTFSSSLDNLADQMSKMKVDTSAMPVVKVATTTRGRRLIAKPTKATTVKPTAKPAPRARSKATTTAAAKPAALSKAKVSTTQLSEASSSTAQCFIIQNFQAELAHRSVLANLLQDNIEAASALLAQIENNQDSPTRDVSHLWVMFKTLLAQSFKQIAENIAVNTLPESTIAFPAVNLKDRRLSEDVVAKRAPLASSTTTKGSRAKKPVREEFAETLCNARDRLAEAHAACATNGPNYMFQQVSMALGTVTVLLSAISGGDLGGFVHPLYAAYMGGTFHT